MPLALDARQRAMLQEMGVHVWLAGTDAAVAAPGAGHASGTASARLASTHAPPASRAATAPPVAAPASTHAAPAVPAQAAVVLQAVGGANWSELQQAAAHCQACSLCAGRSRTTLSPGSGGADWMVVGDPPDEAEDAAGHPFAHEAGVLLDNMLAALGLQRSTEAGADLVPQPATVANVSPVEHSEPAQRGHRQAAPGAAGSAPSARAYVSNVVKCRPPHGTLVQADNLAQCAAYLQREIALVQPKVIVAMGRFANQLLLGETPELATLPLGKLRGQLRHYRGIVVVPTYHPKTLLHNPADKAKAWADLCLAADVVAGLRTP